MRVFSSSPATKQLGDILPAEAGTFVSYRTVPMHPGIEGWQGEALTGYRGQMPLRPAHVRAMSLASGDIALSWTPRLHSAGDDWSGEAALSDAQSFSVEVVQDGVVRRTLQTPDVSVIYTATHRSEDGVTTAPVSFAVRAVSPGTGFASAETHVAAA